MTRPSVPGRVHVEWGPTGAAALVDAGAEVVVVVDVLSFTTTTCVALERGLSVLPFRWKDERAAAYAAEHDAVLAVGRSQPGLSLSPAVMATASGPGRVVLPSPNGSTITTLLAERGVQVVTAALRNRTAVARWLAGADRTVGLVASGERWPDGTLRPAVEDLWGVGAVLAALPGDRSAWSPEARHAEAAYRAVEEDLRAELLACASGVELVEYGFPQDVEVAAEVDAALVVPLLRDGELAPA